MKVIEPGHIYLLDYIDGDPPEGMKEHDLVFVNREATPHPGTQTQEVLRALINRTQHCDNCLRWKGNDGIIYHLRMALALHEARALIRKAEKELYKPEDIVCSELDGHFYLSTPNI